MLFKKYFPAIINILNIQNKTECTICYNGRILSLIATPNNLMLNISIKFIILKI